MPEELDEAKVTAYALGELDDEERKALEPLIAGTEAARREVEEIRRAAAALREAFAATPQEALTPEQRHRINVAARKPDAWHFGLPGRTAFLSSAAVLVVGIVMSMLWRFRSVPATDGLRVDPSALAPYGVSPPTSTTTPRPGVAPPPTTLNQATASRGLAPGLSKEQDERLRSLGYVGHGRFDEFQRLRVPSAPFNTEAYEHNPENGFVLVAQDPRSTFSVDVDTASYAIVRRFLNGGELPPADAVRIEELINYFPYSYAPPRDQRPFAVHMDVAACPWKPDHRLVRVAIKGREVPRAERPPANLVFLLDVSGSMDEPDKLPLVKAAMRVLVNELGPRDRVAIVVYAGAEGLALPSTPATQRTALVSAIESLSPGGTTHGSAGIRLAYETATEHFIDGGINRVILATDGDFNVGVTSQGALVRLIEEKAKTGVFLTALGFGMGNLKDSTLEKLADHGNGNYAYIDAPAEARKVLVEQVGGTLETIAKDVKLQLEFNPRRVKAFRLIGYENRVLAHQDFNDDKRDAGEIGAGHTVTAFYELVPVGVDLPLPSLDPLKYQAAPRPVAGPDNGELLMLKLRYKLPDADESSLFEVPLRDSRRAFEEAAADFRFAAAVAAFGMTLRESPHRADVDLTNVLEWARTGLGEDRGGIRAEFLQLVEMARRLRAR